MAKVLIIGPNYFNFLPATESAFSRLGWEVSVTAYDNPIHPYTTWMKWKYKLSRHRDRMQTKSRVAFADTVLADFRTVRPNLVFILNGDILDTETLDAFRREGARVALWLFDNRERLPRAAGQATHVDRLFCFERADAEWFLDRGVDAVFLPQACDTEVYHPLPLPKDIDILFVGNLWNSPRRKQLMQSVIRAFPDRRIIVYGLYQPWYKGLVKWLTRPYKSVFKNRTLPPEKVNESYNRARVVVNIHQELQKDGANPRVFEICGSGAYQVCDANDYIRSLFHPGDIGLYSSREELLSALSWALENDTDGLAASARQTVLSEHTFVCRIRTVLSSIYGKDSLSLLTTEDS